MTIFTPQGKKVIVPCAKCLACLSNLRNDWAFRLYQEYKHSRGSAYFVTLTYDRKNLNLAGYELQKRDLQLFFKRLRKRSKKTGIRYFAVGEYGSKTLRPHYHILLFNSNEKDIREAWQKGIVHIGSTTEASIMYTLKYMVQPDIRINGKQKPFRLMSRAYGIGGKYLTDEIVQWHRDGAKNYAFIDDKLCRLPRYFRTKIWYGDISYLSDKWKWIAVKRHRLMLREFVRKYGSRNANKILKERRNAFLSQIKSKVAFTQTL